MKLDICPIAKLHPVTTPVARATGRTRLRAYADENGFAAAEAGPDADADEFVRGHRVVHVRYDPDERITDVLVNGQSYCPQSTQAVDNRAGGLVIHRCPECEQDVGLDATGRVLPQSAWIAAAVRPR